MLGIAVFVFCMSSYRSAPLGKVETDTIRVVCQSISQNRYITSTKTRLPKQSLNWEKLCFTELYNLQIIQYPAAAAIRLRQPSLI